MKKIFTFLLIAILSCNVLIAQYTGGSSDGFFVSIIEPCILPTAVITPTTSNVICQGSYVVLSGNSSNGLSYQWIFNGADVTGATDSIIGCVLAGEYQLKVNNTCGFTVSPVVTLTNAQPLLPGNISTNQFICYGGTPATITGTSGSGEGGINYQWESTTDTSGLYGWISIPNAIAPDYSPPSLINSVLYRRLATDVCSSSYTNIITLIVLPLPVVVLSDLNPQFCITDPDIVLTGIPQGGIFFGSGVVDSIFSPSQTSIGQNIVSYQYTDIYGCSNTDEDTVFVDVCSKIENNFSAKIAAVPNPNTGKFQLILPSLIVSFTCALYDMQGKELLKKHYTQNSGNVDIDITTLSSGLYLLNISTNQFVVSQKIRKE